MSKATKNDGVESDEKNTKWKGRKRRRRQRRRKKDVESDEKNDNVESDEKNGVRKTIKWRINYPALNKLDYYLAYDTSDHRRAASKPLLNNTSPVLIKLDYTLAYDTSDHRRLSPNLSITIRHQCWTTLTTPSHTTHPITGASFQTSQ